MYYIIIITLILMDQFTKYMVKANFELYQSVPVIKGVINMTYIHNNGAAFSILQDKQTFLILFTAIVSTCILIYLIKNIKTAHWTMLLSLSLIIAGGVGNMIDRIVSGYVVDFIEFKLFQFPVFNIADMSVVGGSMLLVFYILVVESRVRNKKGMIHDK